MFVVISHPKLIIFYKNLWSLVLSLVQKFMNMKAINSVSWKRMILTSLRSTVTLKPLLWDTSGNLLDVLDSTAKKIHNAILPFKLPAISSQRKWAEEFQDMTEIQNPGLWKEIYSSPYHTVRDTKVQAFVYRLVHRIIPCNKYLANIRIKNEATCSFCDSIDSLQHFVFHCQPVRTLWTSLSSWLAVNASEREVLFGFRKTTHKQQLSTSWQFSWNTRCIEGASFTRTDWRSSRFLESSALGWKTKSILMPWKTRMQDSVNGI